MIDCELIILDDTINDLASSFYPAFSYIQEIVFLMEIIESCSCCKQVSKQIWKKIWGDLGEIDEVFTRFYHK